MKIGALASATDTQVETIRYYEREGLLPPPLRTQGNYRIYNGAQVDRLSFIRHCRSLDMTLDEIRALLSFRDAPDADCGEVNLLLDQHIGHVAARIRELRELQKQLLELRQFCRGTQDTAHCGILTQLTLSSRGTPTLRGASVGHLSGAHKAVRRSDEDAKTKARKASRAV